MKRHYVLCALILAVVTILCSCTFMMKPLDKNIGFSAQLNQLEDDIRSESWAQAEEELEEAKEAWVKIKPWIQIDIDHDYVHELEENLTRLEGYIATEVKSEALATMLMIHETWDDMQSL